MFKSFFFFFHYFIVSLNCYFVIYIFIYQYCYFVIHIIVLLFIIVYLLSVKIKRLFIIYCTIQYISIVYDK